MQAEPGGAYAPVPIEAGAAFEINNAVPHQVANSATEERVHLLLDWAEAPMACARLRPGQRCEYANQKGIIC